MTASVKLADMPVESFIDLTLVYGGEEGFIDARTLGASLLAFTRIVDGVNEGLLTGKRIQVEVEATESGSFLVNLKLLESLLQTGANLLTDTQHSALGIVVECIAAALMIRAKLGKKPLSKLTSVNGQVTIKHADTVMIVSEAQFNAATKPKETKEGLDDFYASLRANLKIENVQLLNKERKPIFIANRKEIEFADASEAVVLDSQDRDKEREKVERRLLSVVKQSFDPLRKWEFAFQGEVIGAFVTDKAFNERVQSRGEAFYARDELLVSMRLRQNWNENIQAFVTYEHVVEHVFKHQTPKVSSQTVLAGFEKPRPKKRRRKKDKPRS